MEEIQRLVCTEAFLCYVELQGISVYMLTAEASQMKTLGLYLI